ncbi:hypothetical protein M2390_001438 [Mycetocola sp. BIGb0189]|uniref:hypothetical protein n=1 Tax=Mycetocola sp. BIGb0189 TaxID=2940604 RepID=UPI0021683672|nr:hypothetical protein [Mycetocola sp. BIGb0189]MCS4276256.1 hypothetical protein [Mycetocola sp. BIGb0189]
MHTQTRPASAPATATAHAADPRYSRVHRFAARGERSRTLGPGHAQSRALEQSRALAASRALTLGLGLALSLGLALTGCAGNPDAASPTVSVSASAEARPGSDALSAGIPLDAQPSDSHLPAPGATVAPITDSDADANVPSGLHILLIGSGSDHPALLAALQERAATIHATLTVCDPTGSVDQSADELVSAQLSQRPDLVMLLGERGIDTIDRVSSANLDQRFVILGAQLPEPTHNVTAVIWPGASARGLSPETIPQTDPTATSESLEARYAKRAVSEGITVATTGHTGFVTALSD